MFSVNLTNTLVMSDRNFSNKAHFLFYKGKKILPQTSLIHHIPTVNSIIFHICESTEFFSLKRKKIKYYRFLEASKDLFRVKTHEGSRLKEYGLSRRQEGKNKLYIYTHTHMYHRIIQVRMNL